MEEVRAEKGGVQIIKSLAGLTKERDAPWRISRKGTKRNHRVVASPEPWRPGRRLRIIQRKADGPDQVVRSDSSQALKAWLTGGM